MYSSTTEAVTYAPSAMTHAFESPREDAVRFRTNSGLSHAILVEFAPVIVILGHCRFP